MSIITSESRGSITTMCCAFLKNYTYTDSTFVFKFHNKNHYENSKVFLKYLVFKLKNVKIKDNNKEVNFLQKYEFDDSNYRFTITFFVNINSAMLRYGIFCYLRKCVLYSSLIDNFNILVKEYPKYNKLHLFEIAICYAAYIIKNGSGYSTQVDGYLYKMYSLEEVVEKLINKNNTQCQTYFNEINKKINQDITKELMNSRDIVKFASILLKNR